MPRLAPLASTLFAFIAFTFHPWAAHGQTGESNLLAFANGALIESVSSTWGEKWDAIWLLDENPATGWSTAEELTLPATIVISLPQRSELRRFEFDTARTDPPDTAARDVEIFVSDLSATTGFTRLATIQLRPDADRQSVALMAPGVGRWVKLVVTTTNGSTEYAQIMDVRGFGVALDNAPPPDLSGTYDSEAYGKVHLRQEGATLSGCSEKDGGLVHGGLEGHLLLLRWQEQPGGSGPALMVPFRDGTGFRGLWRNEGETEWKETWDLRKVSTETGACAHWIPGTQGANPVTRGLADEGRVRLYGIAFDPDGDAMHADAMPAIGHVVEALKTHPAWSITVEDHTDAIGTIDSDRALSARRAAAVKTALVGAGIAGERIATAGLGRDQPVDDNATALGRARNRRVEVLKR